MIRALPIVVLLAACGGPAEVASVGPVVPDVEAPSGPPPSIAPYAGTYTLSGEAAEDGCGGEIVLIAQSLQIDAAARALRADVVDHDYEAHIEDDHLVATGRFDVSAENACPESTVYERWELDHAGQGAGLEGSLYSTWLMWPSCMNVCTVRFAVRAVPQAELPE